MPNRVDHRAQLPRHAREPRILERLGPLGEALSESIVVPELLRLRFRGEPLLERVTLNFVVGENGARIV